MSRSPRDTAVTRALLARVEQRATGSLTVGTGPLQIAVHLLQGDIIAATAADDQVQVVRMLLLRGVLPPAEADELEERLEGGGTIMGYLLQTAGGPLLDGILRDRFHQNVVEFVSSAQEPKFEAKDGVFVENVQLGHDTGELIASCCDDYAAAIRIDPDQLLVRGGSDSGQGPARALLAAKLGPEPRTVRSIIQEAPLESIRARLVVADLIRAGVAQPFEPAAPTSGLGPAATPEAETTGVVTSPLPPPMAEQASNSPDEPPQVAPPLPLEAHALFSSAPERSELPEPELDLAPSPEPGPSGPLTRPFGRLDEVDDISEDPTEQVGFTGWLADANPVHDDELNAFSDHDSSRGASGDGAFSTKEHHRDRVDVSGMDGPPEPSPGQVVQPRGLEDGPAIRTSGPTITEEEVLRKIDVVNAVLSTIVDAFDAADAPGRGRAMVQVLVDGGPTRYSALLQEVRVSDDGMLPGAGVVRNLFHRPAAEHRQLLHNGLLDMIERALSSAADELPDEHFDRVLESIAGYRQRLGR